MNEHTHIDQHESDLADETLDARMRRLENAIAALQDTRLMEQRLLERVQGKLQQSQPSSGEVSNGEAHALIEAGRTLLPGVLRAVGSQFDAATSPLAPGGTTSIFSARNWILTDLIQEIRTFFVLYFDYRYRVSRAARVIPLAALIMFLVSWLGLRSVVLGPIVGPVVDYGLNFFLVILVYKTLQREAARYRSQVAYLPPI